MNPEKQRDRILTLLTEKRSKGEKSISLWFYLHPDVKRFLMLAGYTIDEIDHDFGHLGCEIEYIISWED